jgi:hypothetical protein
VRGADPLAEALEDSDEVGAFGALSKCSIGIVVLYPSVVLVLSCFIQVWYRYCGIECNPLAEALEDQVLRLEPRRPLVLVCVRRRAAARARQPRNDDISIRM